MEYFDLTEFNILKLDDRRYTFVSIDGTSFNLSKDIAAVILSLQGNTEEAAFLKLKNNRLPVNKALFDQVVGWLIEHKLASKETKSATRYHLENVLKNLSEFDSGPVTLQDLTLTLSSRCFLKCKYCFRKDFKYPDCLTLYSIHRLNKDLARLGCLSLNLSGGEPVLFPDFTTRVASDAKANGLKHISVNTTGYGLSEKILNSWRAAGVNCLNISLDTLDEKLYDRTAGLRGALKETLRAIDLALEKSVKVHINVTVYFGDSFHIEKIAKFALKKGIFGVRINPCIPTKNISSPPPTVMKKIVKTVSDLAAAGYPVYSPISLNEKLPPAMICPAGITRAAVEPDGNVGACSFLGLFPRPAGNILKQPFLKIWTAGDWGYYRQSPTDISSLCRQCRHRSFCISNCLAFALNLTGDAKARGIRKCPWKTNNNKWQRHSPKIA